MDLVNLVEVGQAENNKFLISNGVEIQMMVISSMFRKRSETLKTMERKVQRLVLVLVFSGQQLLSYNMQWLSVEKVGLL